MQQPNFRFSPRPPDIGEIEVTVLSNGAGESVVVAFGDGYWMVIDSFLHDDPQSTPAPVSYLQWLFRDMPEKANVSSIVVSHYHDDHTKGINQVGQHYPEAQIHWAPLLREHQVGAQRQREVLLNAIDELKSSDRFLGDGLRDLLAVANDRFTIHPLGHSPHFRLKQLAPVRSFSLPDLLTVGKIREANRNLASLVFELELNAVNAVFGADLENDSHLDPSQPTRGWQAVVRDELDAEPTRDRQRPLTSLMKFPHHGSEGAIHDEFLKLRCTEDMTVIVTRHARGSQYDLPTKAAVDRLENLGYTVLIVGQVQKPRLPFPAQQGSSTSAQFVTFRRRPNESGWRNVYSSTPKATNTPHANGVLILPTNLGVGVGVPV